MGNFGPKNPKFHDPTLTPVMGVEEDVFRELCLAVDSPRSLACWMLYKSGEFRQLVELDIRPELYCSVKSFEGDYLVTSFFQKYRDFNLGVDREERAFQKWLIAEESCRKTNEKFRMLWDSNSPLFTIPAMQVYELAQQKVRSILAASKHEMLSDQDFVFISEHCRFGPGADSSTVRDNTSAYHKFGTRGSVTPWVLPLFDDIMSEDFRLDLVHESDLVGCNRLSFVPKNAKIDRAICTEPRWNIYLQLGIGDLISKRLLRVGIDLKNQMPNREAASRAHVDGLATIDLSSASDTVSKNLILDMLPDEWSDLLFKSRSPVTVYRNKSYQLEKISSMGNGYTFPLESLVFYAFAYAACRFTGSNPDEIRVFGDDIILPSEASACLVETLVEFGFSVNTDKSFFTGNFFESCGTDYFGGKNVRPIFLKEAVSNVDQAFRLANQILEFARRSNCYLSACSKFMVAYHCIVQRIPKSHRLFGPLELSSGVLHAPFDVCLPARASRGWEGYRVEAFVAAPKGRSGFNPLGHLYSKLSNDIDTGQSFYTRNQVIWRRKRVYVAKYTDFFIC